MSLVANKRGRMGVLCGKTLNQASKSDKIFTFLKNWPFSSLGANQKLKMHTFKMFWDTMGCPKRHKDLSERVKEDMGNMERYWDITEEVRDIMGSKERDWGIVGEL
jgi:NDP-sugar pyrophosphorylase family protein